MTGLVDLGKHTIIHPKAQLIAEGGDIIIGDCCIIEEKVRIINRKQIDPETGKPSTVKRDLKIGSYNMFEVGTVIDSAVEIGDMNEFGVKSVVPEGAKIESFC